MRDYLSGDKVVGIGMEIKVNPKMKKATGFVKKPSVLVRELKCLTILLLFCSLTHLVGLDLWTG